ncbi:Hypothetical protein SMAX5B_020343 [Scophthalmus maximus]|uniref:Uncharacterized protein n=1 Tax=Scophthalmus maximus TaxID=52904 RepID=A0A2U9CP73_SCOMX|nr:Hypothetical protein SMAX5B_020343 [Scophthalmus maximus]
MRGAAKGRKLTLPTSSPDARRVFDDEEQQDTTRCNAQQPRRDWNNCREVGDGSRASTDFISSSEEEILPSRRPLVDRSASGRRLQPSGETRGPVLFADDTSGLTGSPRLLQVVARQLRFFPCVHRTRFDAFMFSPTSEAFGRLMQSFRPLASAFRNVS